MPAIHECKLPEGAEEAAVIYRLLFKGLGYTVCQLTKQSEWTMWWQKKFSIDEYVARHSEKNHLKYT